MTEPELDRCKHCGGEAAFVLGISKGTPHTDFDEVFSVMCYGCPIRLDAYFSKQGAIAAWNRRV